MSHSQTELEMPGRPREVDVDDVAAVVRDYDGEPIVASTVADEIGCDRRTATRRLREAAALPDDVPDSEAVPGLRTKLVGGNARVYWWDRDRETDGTTDTADTAARVRRESPAAPSPDRRADSVAADTERDEPGSDAVQAVVDAVAAGDVDVEHAGWDDDHRLADRKAAARAVLEYAVTTGESVGKSSEIVADVRDQYPIEDQNDETWWLKNVRPVLQAVGDYSRGNHRYSVDPDRLEAAVDQER